MKKLLATLILTLLIWSVKAQNIYVLGDYIVHDWSQGERETVAAIYKNGELLYTAGNDNTVVYPKTVLCDSYENVYWMFNSEIWKNDQPFVTTDNTNKSIGNMYLKNDTLYYAGRETIDGVSVAKIWKGENFTPYLTLGDGIHSSAIRNLDIDETTGDVYYCGCLRTDSIYQPAVWDETGLLYTLPFTTNFEASEICFDSGNIYTLNKGQSYPVYETVYKNETQLYSSLSEFDTRIFTLCAKNNNWYTYKAALREGHHCIIKNNVVILDLGHISSIDYNWPITKMKCMGNDIYTTGFLESGSSHIGTIWKNFEVFQTMNSHCTVVGDICYYEPPFPAMLSEWYYEIENGDGTVTYQHLKAENDTTINNERPTVIVRSNTQYDRDTISIEVTHEYVFERNGIVYWWNNELQEFTTLYNLTAEADDEWEIKVGTESIIVHVDSVGVFEYDGESRKMLHISDAGNIFNGDIVVGYGHMTSFFPEKLMNRSASYTVDGLRCYWVEDALLYHNGDEDCDAIYAQIHAGVEETTEDAAFAVYPNPANNVLFMETQSIASLQTATYRITNLLGQTVFSGDINAETQQIDIKKLPSGMYFISVGGQTVKFVVK